MLVNKAEYGVGDGRTYDHLDLTDLAHEGTYTSQRVDGLGKTRPGGV